MEALSERAEAVARAARMYEAQRLATVASNNASAELLRIVFLEIVDQFPSKIKGLSFSSEYCYDDEGGYFISDGVWALQSKCTADIDGWDDHALEDLNSYGHEALCLLCGVSEYAFEGEVTVAEARERRF